MAMAGGAAVASDYSNECRSADGGFIIFDGELEQTGDKPGTSRPYAIAAEQVLNETEGYCVPADPAANGARFVYVSRSWRQTIVVASAGGSEVRVEMLCQLAASGLPAAFNCDRDVVTRQQTAPGSVQRYELGAPGTWSHNGSSVKLVAEGANRRFVYMWPRQGMLDAGVRPGMDLFEGERRGDTYVGTARYWSSRCGVQSFPVTGLISEGERFVTLTGDAPRLDDACRPVGRIPQKLMFERQ